MAAVFFTRFGRQPYDWQLDVAECFLLKLDSLVIAGTGTGKTIPFMLPLLINPAKYVLIISPLKVLQHDQVKRFRKMKISAVAVNGDTYNAKVQGGLESGKYQAIFASPEMCLQDERFRQWLKTEVATEGILGLIIDEVHCISQWGGDFRKLYGLLDQLRGLLPLGTPVHGATATLTPDAVAEVAASLSINLGEAFFLNLGNDRPNITPSVIEMNGSSDFKALNTVLQDPTTIDSPEQLNKAIIFTNSVKKTHKLCQHVRQVYGNKFDDSIAFLHAHRTRRAKRTVMRKFRQGKIRILVATEAAGMGADIPDIELIIQFGLPKSLTVWTQRAGRAGRSPNLHARAILLVEKSAFQRKKAPKGKTPGRGDASDSESSDSSSGSDAAADDGMVWGKKVEEPLRKYITGKRCRRDVADEHFNNPTRKPPTGPCCDNCIRPPTPPPSRPQTPQSTPSSSAHSTPSKTANLNGKRPMRRPRGDGPSVRRKDHLKAVRSALDRWRVKTVLSDQYSETSFTAEAILPNPNLTTLASNARLRTVEDIVSTLKPPWMMARRHGQEILTLLDRLDRADREARHAKTLENRETRKRATATRNAAKKANTGQSAAPPLMGSTSYNTTPFTPARTAPLPWPSSVPPHLSFPPQSPIPYPPSLASPSLFYSTQGYSPAQMQALHQNPFIYSPNGGPYFYYYSSPR
ncbi:P-loop containing nucleoside triphosphate hydrolase protein [Mycena rebaudengoi]|nr:P-loop containing nucleoside triphosphate hydrolase protein [Mycena rebaudengoi]